MTLSTSTSALSLLNSSGETINRQITDSPQSRALQQSIDSNLKAIASLQANIERMPANWITKRGQQVQQLADMQKQNRAMINGQSRLLSSGKGSAVADSSNRLSAYGITRTRLSMLAAVLLDLILFCVSMALAFVMGRRAKKSSGAVRNLKAVA